MTDVSPLTQAQQTFSDKVAWRALPSEDCALPAALQRVLSEPVTAPLDMPPYHRAIVEGYLVHTADTAQASETSPVRFAIVGEVMPGDAQCPRFSPGQAIRVATGSIVPDGGYSIVRMWEAKQDGQAFTIGRPFPPRFFIEDQGCDMKKGQVAVAAGSVLHAAAIGQIAALGIDQVKVMRRPQVTVFASGDEVIPYTAPLRPGQIRDCNSVMLSAAVTEAGGMARSGGIMRDDFDQFVAAVRRALQDSDMIVIAGGTAVGDRDFISDLLREVGELVVDGVQMKSGRPLIMGVAGDKPLVCVAGHPPEALRGFRLFGIAALNRLLGVDAPLPADVA
ncbi:MAG: molybdopterin molybdotransferase MoeA [Gammaproteobacteria bacterium]|nr:molybdopterin molybdotransferase MoeA [Gammaproteobacteria bacterium]